MADTCRWIGRSGTTYRYYVLDWPADGIATKLPGNYVFAKEVRPDRFVPLYFGQTDDLGEPFDRHAKAECARRNGVTHVHARLNTEGEAARREEEADLIANFTPTCNG